MPIQPLDIFQTAERVVGGNTNILPPSSNGDGTRQNNIPPNRIAVPVRNMVRWFVPETGIVDMYINPQNMVWRDKKSITNTRTKGGYVLQYWGEELTALSISGTTGSSGIEGINVLFDIYRGEQVAFDPFALVMAAKLDQQNASDTLLGQGVGSSPASVLDVIGLGSADSFLDQVSNSLESGNNSVTRPRPTLASLAFTVEMYWSGWTFRGYFTDFTLTESADKLGLFDYNMTFMCTQRKGWRSNFLGWHRSAVSGASNSDPELGVPYSYNGLTSSQATTSTPSEQSVISLNDRLQTSNGYVGDPGFSSLF